jgi:hypothetical protein
MAISNYTRPQLTIEQILENVPSATKDRLTAVVIGPQYSLNRYGKETNVYGVNFTAVGLTGGATAGIPLKVFDASVGSSGAYIALDTDAFTVAASDVDVYIANGEASLFSSTASSVLGRGIWGVKSDSATNVLVLGSTAGKLTSTDTSEIYAGFSERSVTVGDIFYAKSTTGDATYRRRVVTAVSAQEVTLSGPIVSGTFATPVTATLSATAGGATGLTVSATAGLAVNMPVVSISGTTASFSDYTYITNISGSTVTLNLGVTGASGATVGFANVLADLQVAAPVTTTLDSADFTLDATNDQVTVTAAASVNITERASPNCLLIDGKGTLYVSYRALKVVSATEGLISISTPSDIESLLGVISLDNDLAFGASECLSGAQGKSIYALRVAADTTTAYAAALRKIESTDAVYALAPLTDNLDIQKIVAAHCESMSVKTIKNFRRCYVGTDSPGEYAVQKRGTDGTTKLLVDVVVNSGGIYADLTNASDINLTTLSLTEGDLLKLIDSNGDYTGVSYKIDSVTDSNSMILSTGPVSTTSNIKVEFWKADTGANQALFVEDISKALGSRRAVNVWSENGTRLINGTSTVIPNKYVAAEIAGLRTAVIPWQGLTLTQISSITDCPAMYTRYNGTDLDAVASQGVFIVTQEAESGAVFIRHQLTTDSSHGNLAYEDSVGVSLDFISFQIKDALSSFIGRKNVTQETLTEIYNVCWGILNSATKVAFTAGYGPQLNGFENAAGDANKIDVKADPILKDRVSVFAKLLMPLPLNNIDVVLDASVDFAL